ncbi:pentapeptide repeat-containing protein [Actinosynnema sp. NPDC020468]|uniref:pentapeptide repeat-containing protein n=1 Tax=Actinosynnema sp. NPDC020468 TaxID=3154488 RepID=UPI0033E711B4
MSYLWIAGAVVIVAAGVLLAVWTRAGRTLLVPTLAASIGAFLLVTGWLFAVDAGAPKHEAIKTGGLAGGALIALYALWLNDRRRRTDEARQRIDEQRQAIEVEKQRLESDRAEHDRSRVADERFARSVELLGHDTEQVRTGGMHALAGLARSRAEYTQTVLDVLCAYLRRPFERTADRSSERELEVRLTAQRLIADLLPPVGVPDAPRYALNLTRAYLEYFDLSRRQVGELTARAARLAESNSLHDAVVHGDVWLTGATSTGRLHLHDMEVRGRAWFSGFVGTGADFARTAFLGPNKFADSTFTDRVSFAGARFAEPADFTGARFESDVDLRLAEGASARTHALTVSLDHDVLLPEGWTVEARGASTGLVHS